MNAPARASAYAGALAGCKRRALVVLPWLVLTACLETDPSEVVGYSPNVLDEGTTIPSVEDDPVIKMRIATNSGVGEVVALHSAYASGQVVQYWDFGVGSSSAEPIWLFRRKNGDMPPEEVGHPDLIDTVPGDEGYSAFHALYLVYVTDRYDGERITSPQALEDAIELGLVEEPVAMAMAANWPVVPATTVLEMGDGNEPLAPVPVYYRGRVASELQLGGTEVGIGMFPIERGSFGMPKSAYVLRRQNELNPLDESKWMADLNADGDMQDSNVVFSVGPGEPGYTSLWQQVDVIVPPDYEFGDSQAESDLFVTGDFGLAAQAGAVIEYAPSMMLLNRPIRYVAP